MEISFKSDGEVQLVEMVGVIGETEAAAVRFKLEEKINAGKQKVLLDLSRYEMSNDAARAALFGLIVYLLARHVLVVSCGLPPERWPQMVLPDGRQIKNFLTRLEGLNFARSTPVPDPKAHLKTLAPTNDEEAKDKALVKLLEQYDVFQHGVDLDPFRLEFLASQYKSAPNREALNTESKVREAISQVQQENEALNKECEILAAQLKQLIAYRKYPLDPKEFELKSNSLMKEIAESKAGRDQFHKDLNALSTDIAAIHEDLNKNLRDVDGELAELRTKLKLTTERFAHEEKNLKTRDAQEQSDFEAKMKSKIKTPQST